MVYKRFDATDFADAIKEEVDARREVTRKRQQAINDAVVGPYHSTWEMWRVLFERRDVAGLAAFESTDEFQTALKHRIEALETSPLVRELPDAEQRLIECRARLKSDQSSLKIGTNTPSTVEAAHSGSQESDEPSAPVANQAGWIEVARSKALEYIARHRDNDLFPPQRDVCEHVAREMRKEKRYSDHGKPLSDSYIQKNAIQGKWWQANKP